MYTQKNQFLEKEIEYYQTSRPYFYVFLRPYELFLFEQVKKDFKHPIVDFGCGDGFFSKFLFKEKEIEYGIDLESRLGETASIFYKQFLVSQNNEIPLPSDLVATVLSNSVFEHLNDPQKTLSELYRILKKGGRLYTTITLRNWENHFLGNRILPGLYKKLMRKVQRHSSFYTLNQWKKLFMDNHFDLIEIRPYLLPSQVRLVEFFHYLSFPSFILYPLFGRWNTSIHKGINALYGRLFPVPTQFESQKEEHTCCFFVLEKK